MIDKLLRVIMGLVFVFSGLTGYAQPPVPDEPPPPNPVPISGIEILVGVGALLGVRRLIQHRKTKI